MQSFLVFLSGFLICFSFALNGQQEAEGDFNVAIPKSAAMISEGKAELNLNYLDSNGVLSLLQVDSARFYFQLMQNWATRQADNKWEIKPLRTEADQLVKADKFTLAIPVLERLIGLYKFNNDLPNQAIMHRKLAYTFRKTGQISAALSHYQLSIQQASKAGAEGVSPLASAYNSRGSLKLSLKEFEAAEEDYLLALPLYEKLSKQVGIAAVYNNLSLVYGRSGQYEKAKPFLEKSLELKISENDQRGMANTYANLGDLAFDQNNFSAAAHYHLLSIHIRDSLELTEDATQSYTRMGEIALAGNQPSEAIKWCSKSCDIADTEQFWEAQVACHQCLHEAYQLQKEWELSLVELEHSRLVKDSVDQQNKIQETRFQEAKKEYQLALQKAEEQKATLARQLSLNKSIKWGMLGLLIGIFLLILRTKRNKQVVNPASPLQSTVISEAITPRDEIVESTQFVISNEYWLVAFRTQLEEMIEARQKLTTGALANAAHLSERQLLRRIKEQAGLTTTQYIQEVKLQMAQRWLEEGRFHTVKSLAEALGFKSSQYFSRLFADRFGRVPSEYLKS